MTQHFPSVLAGSDYFNRLSTQLSWVEFKPYRSVLRECARMSHEEMNDYFPDLVEVVELVTGRHVSQSFVNHYRARSQDWCPYHRDVYGVDSATVSFGAQRDFLLKADGTNVVQKWTLNDGDIYTLPLATNLTHTHSVPKRTTADARVSLLCFLE
jgi:alkylated DNA repair dioxygenase AlkB